MAIINPQKFTIQDTLGFIMKIKESTNASLLNKKVSEIVIEKAGAGELLKTLGIKLEEFEDSTLIQACAALKLNENDALKSLANLEKNKKFNTPNNIHSWTPAFLIQYIKQEYHTYTRSLLEDATSYEERARAVHAPQYPELNQIQWYFESLKEKMSFHLKFQEEKFFPSVKSFLTSSNVTDGKVRSMEKQIYLVQKDQEELEYFLEKIAELSDNFTPPADACTTLRLFYSTLSELNEDLKSHHFVESEYLISVIQQAVEVAKK